MTVLNLEKEDHHGHKKEVAAAARCWKRPSRERERVSSSIIGAAASLQEWPEKRAGIQLGQI